MEEKTKFEVIITKGWPNDDQVLLDNITCTYIQNPDNTESRGNDDDVCQELTLSTRDGGGGKYINIKTNSWSINSPEDFLTILNDFKNRCGI